MPIFSVEFTKAVQKDLAKLGKRIPQDTRDAIKNAITNLGTDPRPHGSKVLSGGSGLYRIRVGAYRICYAVEDSRVRVLVVLIANRGNVYEKLARRV